MDIKFAVIRLDTVNHK